MIKKLKSTSGESIAETMVAVLISALALLMLAGTINSSSRIITNTQTKLIEYYNASNTLAADGALSNPCTISVSSSSPSISDSFSAQYGELSGSSILGERKLVVYG